MCRLPKPIAAEDALLKEVARPIVTTVRTRPFQVTKPSRGDKHPRGFVKSAVLKTITEHPQGMTTAETTRRQPHDLAVVPFVGRDAATAETTSPPVAIRGQKFLLCGVCPIGHPNSAPVLTSPTYLGQTRRPSPDGYVTLNFLA